MPTEIIQTDYRYIILDDEPSAAAAALASLRASGVDLAGFSEFPHGPGKLQLNLIAQDSAALSRTALAMGLTLSQVKTGFLIRGDDAPAAAIEDVLIRLAGAHIRVTALQAVAAGGGRFGALLWVKSSDVDEASKALGATILVHDLIDEASAESFPASDPPALVMSPLEQ